MKSRVVCQFRGACIIMLTWIHTLTVDASHNALTGAVGIGIVIQERQSKSRRGPVIEEIAEAHKGVSGGSPEKLAILRAIEIAILRGFRRVKIRSDCSSLRRKIRTMYKRPLRVAPSKHNETCNTIIRLAGSLEWIDFSYVPRRKNLRAHYLARNVIGLSPLPREEKWDGVPPWELTVPIEAVEFETITLPDSEWDRECPF